MAFRVSGYIESLDMYGFHLEKEDIVKAVKELERKVIVLLEENKKLRQDKNRSIE